MVLIFTLLGPAPGGQKIFVRQNFSKKKIFEKIFAFLTPLQSEIENFELTFSFAFFLKISELFSNLENSNYSRRGDADVVCTHATFTILNLHSMSFLTPLRSKFDNFEWTSSLAFFLKISELFSKPENSNYCRNGSRKRMFKNSKIFSQYLKKGLMTS